MYHVIKLVLPLKNKKFVWISLTLTCGVPGKSDAASVRRDPVRWRGRHLLLQRGQEAQAGHAV